MCIPKAGRAIASDGAVFLAWVTDDPTKPVMQGREIMVSRYLDGAWSTPFQLTHDNLEDYSPQLVVDANDHVLAVWERNKTEQPEDAELDAAYTNAFEIAYAVWDGSAWSAPAFLTNNNALDHGPLLARGADEKPLLVWRQNPAGEVLGSPAAPDTFYTTTWDGSAWSAEQVLLANAAGVMSLSAARQSDSVMAVAYASDTDGDLATNTDQEIYLSTWNGASWGAPARLTNDSQP